MNYYSLSGSLKYIQIIFTLTHFLFVLLYVINLKSKQCTSIINITGVVDCGGKNKKNLVPVFKKNYLGILIVIYK